MFNVELTEENKLSRCQRRKLLFVVPGWEMPNFHLHPFLINKKTEKVKRVELLSLFMSLHLILHLLFSLLNYVEHD